MRASQSRTHRLAAVVSAVLLAFGLTGCSDQAGAASAEPAADCVSVSAGVLAQIEVGATPGKPLALTSAAAVRARPGVYVVAARISAKQGVPHVGVWTVVSLRGVAAPVLVADETASASSTWSSVEEFPQYGVPLKSPAISAARACLDG
jgi:hypothetical protein